MSYGSGFANPYFRFKDPDPKGQLITNPPDLDIGTDPQHCRKMEKALNLYIEFGTFGSVYLHDNHVHFYDFFILWVYLEQEYTYKRQCGIGTER